MYLKFSALICFILGKTYIQISTSNKTSKWARIIEIDPRNFSSHNSEDKLSPGLLHKNNILYLRKVYASFRFCFKKAFLCVIFSPHLPVSVCFCLAKWYISLLSVWPNLNNNFHLHSYIWNTIIILFHTSWITQDRVMQWLKECYIKDTLCTKCALRNL